jgi:hypothetical protein
MKKLKREPIAAILVLLLSVVQTALTQDVARQILNVSVLSPKEKYPLHVHVTQSNVQFVPRIDYSSTTLCYPLFGATVCSTSGSATPTQTGYATMTVSIGETGETTTVYCRDTRWPGYCTGLPVGWLRCAFCDYAPLSGDTSPAAERGKGSRGDIRESSGGTWETWHRGNGCATAKIRGQVEGAKFLARLRNRFGRRCGVVRLEDS